MTSTSLSRYDSVSMFTNAYEDLYIRLLPAYKWTPESDWDAYTMQIYGVETDTAIGNNVSVHVTATNRNVGFQVFTPSSEDTSPNPSLLSLQRMFEAGNEQVLMYFEIPVRK